MLSELPPEVLIEIYGALESFDDLLALGRCSRYFYSLWMSNAESICRAMLPNAILCFSEAQALMDALEETESILHPGQGNSQALALGGTSVGASGTGGSSGYGSDGSPNITGSDEYRAAAGSSLESNTVESTNDYGNSAGASPEASSIDNGNDTSPRAYPPIAYMQAFSYTDDPEVAYQNLTRARQRLYAPATRPWLNSAMTKLLHDKVELSPRTRRYLTNAAIVEASWDCFVDFTLPNLLNNPQNKDMRINVCGRVMTPSERLRFTRTHYRVWTSIILGGTDELRAKRRAFLAAIGDRRAINQMREVCLWLRHHCPLDSQKLGLREAARDGRWQGAMNTIEDFCDAMGGMLPAIHTRGPFGFWTLLDHWQGDRMFDLWRS